MILMGSQQQFSVRSLTGSAVNYRCNLSGSTGCQPVVTGIPAGNTSHTFQRTRFPVSASCRDLQASSLRYPKKDASLFGQFAKPVQRDGGLRIVGFVAAVERANFYPLKSSAFD